MADLKQRSPDLWRSIKDAQTAASKPPLRLVRSSTDPNGQRLRKSTDALRERIQSVAQSYGAGQTSWLWDKDSISDELDQVHQELNLIGAWLADTELSTSGVRQALRRHEAVARRFVQRLGDLEAPQTLKAQQLLRRAEFEQAGQALLELLEGIERELRLLGVGDRLPAPS
ncbi:MAG TPA: hypothetical protein VEQ11_00600 [Chloroflexota bacterium]|nr:hypothetical protein [Chloroflexota bacterium]